MLRLSDAGVRPAAASSRARPRTVPVMRKTPYLTLAALAVFFLIMVAIEAAAASDDDKGGSDGGNTSEYGYGSVQPGGARL